MSSTHELPTQLFRSLQAVLMGAGAAGLMSLTRVVPLLVPSLFHSSTPCLPSLAFKQRVLPTTNSFSTSALRLTAPVVSLVFELPWWVLMSLTRVVPLLIPSLFHSSTP